MTKQILVAMMMFLPPGCAQESSEDATERYFATANGAVEFRFPVGWRKSVTENPFDLQCFSKDEKANIGVFLFAREDLAENVSPSDILQLQIDDMKPKRDNFKLKDAVQIVRADALKLTTIVFSGEKGPSRYYYCYTLVEFDENPEIFAVALQVVIPSYWATYKPILEEITKSARFRTKAVEEKR